MLKFITKFDNISSKITLKGKNNNERYQNSFGGLLSLLSLLAMLSAVLYFSIRFMNFTNPTVIMNQEKRENFVYERFNQIPFLVKITDEKGNGIQNENGLIRMEYLWITANYTNGSIIQEYNPVSITPCNESNLFEYKDIFNQSLLPGYYCPSFKKDVDLIGQYGSNSPYTFSIFLVYQCDNSIKSNNCNTTQEIDKALDNIYLEFIIGDNIFAHSDKDPDVKILSSDRLSITNRSFYRVWLGIHSVEYISDYGLIFEERNKEMYFQKEMYRIDLSLVDKTLLEQSKMPFAAISMQNHKYVSTFKRSYMKFQDLLALLGGILKSIMVIAQTVYLLLGSHLLDLKLVNYIPTILKSEILNKGYSVPSKHGKTYKNIVNDKHRKEKNNLFKSSCISISQVNNNNYVSSKIVTTHQYTLPFNDFNKSLKIIQMKFRLKWYNHIEPFNTIFCQKSRESVLLKKAVQILNSKINPQTIFQTYYQVELINNFIMNKDEKVLYDYIFNDSSKYSHINKKYSELYDIFILNNKNMSLFISSDSFRKNIIENIYKWSKEN